MALKCPECGTTAHTRTSAYESAIVKRTWYQCTNLDCSCTFTALESVERIIMKPQKVAEPENAGAEEIAGRQPQTLNRYGSASKLSRRQQAPV
ncbi:ogr/Delta-like zinc finger family protein [Enterobacter cloacae]